VRAEPEHFVLFSVASNQWVAFGRCETRARTVADGTW
jgi:hypothetical protein